MTEELKPCPFCGGTDLSSGGDDKIVGYWCNTCEATGPNHYGKHDWNARADLPAAETVKPLECENCRHPATKLCQMTTHECDPMPICEQCAAQHDATAAEVNEHEMREFGGAYGMVTYHYLPLPDTTQPDPVKDAAREIISFMGTTDEAAQEVLISGISAMHPNGWSLADRIKFERGFIAALRALAEKEQGDE